MRKNRDRVRVESGFRAWLEGQGLAATSKKNYVVGAGEWLRWCDENEADPLRPTRQDVRAYFGRLLADFKPGTVELKHVALSRFYKFLAEEYHYTGPNPATFVSLKKVLPAPPEPFSRGELLRMLDACRNHQERAVFLLLVGGGLRRAEVYGIKRQDVNPERRTIRVFGKGSRYRLIKPGPTVIDAVMQALEFSDRLCPQDTIDVVWRIVRRLAKRAGIRGRVHPHRFRHAYAGAFLEAGGSVNDLQHILGHQRIDMSLYYARADQERRAQNAQESVDVGGLLLGFNDDRLLGTGT